MSKPEMVNKTSHDSGDVRVNAADFINFMPWACDQLGVDTILDITKMISVNNQKLISTHKTKSRNLHVVPKTMLSAENAGATTATLKADCSADYLVSEYRTVRITATYKGDHLQHIKINKTKHIPRELFIILGMAIKYYPQLYGITINSGIDKYTVYEISKLLPMSNITEISFDNCHCKEANYHILLDHCSRLTMLSLARCRIGDEAAKKIVSKLEHTEPASVTLKILNLSSNHLTDKTALQLAHMLRMNRQLTYLNLADNMLTDEGAVAILKVLYIYALTKSEKIQARRRYTSYLKEKHTAIEKIMTVLRPAAVEVVTMKKKRQSKMAAESKFDVRGQKIPRVKSACGEFALDACYHRRAEEMAIEQVPEDPIAKDIFEKDGWVYSNGNGVLSYLNIAYNNVSYITVKLLLLVLTHQRDLARKPKGLVNVCLEGNALPKCEELVMIESLLEAGLRDKPMKKSSSITTIAKFHIDSKATLLG